MNEQSSIGVHEQVAFLSGTTFSTRLLLELLTRKYKYLKSVSVNSKIITLNTEEEIFTLPAESTTIPAYVEYELFVITYLAKLGPNQQSFFPITSLLVKPRVSSGEQPVIFTIPSSRLLGIKDVRYVFNNLYRSSNPPKLLDNAYAVFDFLNAYFRGTMQDDEENLYSPPAQNTTQGRLALHIQHDIERPKRVQEVIVSLYKEINAELLKQTEHVLVETKKQTLFKVIEAIIDPSFPSDPKESNRLADSFGVLPSLETPDPIPTSINGSKSNDLVRELLIYVNFMTNVVSLSSRRNNNNNNNKIMMQVGENRYSVDDVRQHIAHLRFRILSHVEKLNIKPISPLMSHQLRFTEEEYQVYKEGLFILFPVMKSLLRSSLQSSNDTVLIGPEDVNLLIDGNKSKESRRPIQLKSMMDNKDTILFVLAGRTARFDQLFYGLLVVQKKKSLEPTAKNAKYSRVLYLLHAELEDMTAMTEMANELFNKLNLEGLVCDLQLMKRPSTELYYSSWYTLSLAKMMIENKEITAIPTFAQLFNTVESLMNRVRLDMGLSLFDISDMDRDMEEGMAKETIQWLGSSVSGLARLNFNDEYIDDEILSDMIKSLPLMPHCHVIDPVHWRGTIELNYTKKKAGEKTLVRKLLSEFVNPSTEIILLPVNILNIDPTTKRMKWAHWSLCIIDLSLHTVSYYTSFLGDGYYERFKEVVLDFLATQTPNVEYTVSQLFDEEQPDGSNDCALYVLNMIAKIAVPQNLLFLHTRPTIHVYMTGQLVKSWLRDSRVIQRDVLLEFIDEDKDQIMSSIRGNSTKYYKDRLALYRHYYLSELGFVLEDTHLYTIESIKELKKLLLNETLSTKKNKKNATTSQTIEALFDNTLVLEQQQQEEEPRKRKLSKEKEAATPREKKKARVCVANSPEMIKIIIKLFKYVKDAKYDNIDIDDADDFLLQLDLIEALQEIASPFPDKTLDTYELITEVIRVVYDVSKNKEKDELRLYPIIRKYVPCEDEKDIEEMILQYVYTKK